MLKLAFTTYLLSLTVFIPISGWLADRFGARNVFRLAIAVFTLGSIACGLATSLGGLVAARGLQGIGGAMMCRWGASSCCAPCRSRNSSMRWPGSPSRR